jgi:hypothetical protein
MTKFERFDKSKKWWLVQLRGHGFTQKEIGEMLGYSQQVIAYQLAQLKLQLISKYPFLDPEDDMDAEG